MTDKKYVQEPRWKKESCFLATPTVITWFSHSELNSIVEPRTCVSENHICADSLSDVAEDC